ncbi:MAG: hypothetical protein LUD19_02005 [Clostridia bacterium]|nr:hypothetical protein [Clostridia bacterium]
MQKKYMVLTVRGGEMSQEEQDLYVKYIENKFPDKRITEVNIEVDGDYVNITYKFVPQNFERIRRITGYLVGTVDRFNNAKRAEVHDRVKHGVDGTDGVLHGMEQI